MKGGAREGAGRKSKADEEKVNTIFTNALKTFYKVDNDAIGKEKLVHTLLESQRGQIFIAEHLFGKPEQVNSIKLDEDNGFNLKSIFGYDTDKPEV